MSFMITFKKCPSCGGLHNFTSDEMIQSNGRYEFKCPETGKIGYIKPMIAASNLSTIRSKKALRKPAKGAMAKRERKEIKSVPLKKRKS